MRIARKDAVRPMLPIPLIDAIPFRHSDRDPRPPEVCIEKIQHRRHPLIFIARHRRQNRRLPAVGKRMQQRDRPYVIIIRPHIGVEDHPNLPISNTSPRQQDHRQHPPNRRKTKYHKEIFCVPPFNSTSFPPYTNLPVTPIGNSTSPVIPVPRLRSFTRIIPFGCGILPSTSVNSPSAGRINTRLNPGASGMIPQIVARKSYSGLALHA